MVKKKVNRITKPLQYSPFSDIDRDGVPNVLDCQPNNPNEHGLWDWAKARIVTPIHKKIYTPIVKPLLVSTQRVVKKYTPRVSYTRAAERRAAARRYVERPVEVVRKIKKRIPEKEKLAMFAIKRAPIGMVSTHLIKQLPQFKKLKPEVVTPRIPTVVPMRMGLLAGAEVVTPVLREKVITPIRRGYEKIKPKKVLPSYVRPTTKIAYQELKKEGYDVSGYKSKFEPTKPPEIVREPSLEWKEGKYITKPFYEVTQKIGKKYLEKIEPYMAKPLPTIPVAREFISLGRGAARAPAGLIEYVGMVPSAVEAVVREPKKMAVSVVPGVTVMGRGMVTAARERPAEFVGEMAGMAILTGGVGRGFRVAKPYVSRISPRYVAPKRITPTPIIKEKMPATARMPAKTPTEIMKLRMEEPAFKLTGEPGEVWHAAPIRLKPSLLGEIVARPGAAPVKGIYVGPEAYPKFAGISGIIEAPRRIIPRPTRPTLYSIMAGKVEIPKGVKVTQAEIITAKKLLGGRAPTQEAVIRFARYKKYVEEVAPKKAAYISPEVTAKIPWRGVLEVEAVIPAGARMVEPILSRIFPRFTYVKIPKYKFTRVGRAKLKEFHKEWKTKLKEHPELEKDFLIAEAKLFEKLKKSGELKEVGYEPTKVEVRRLKMKGEEISSVDELIGRPKVKERFEPISRVPREERFRPGEYIVRRPHRRVPITTPIAMFGIRPRGIRERRREIPFPTYVLPFLRVPPPPPTTRRVPPPPPPTRRVPPPPPTTRRVPPPPPPTRRVPPPPPPTRRVPPPPPPTTYVPPFLPFPHVTKPFIKPKLDEEFIKRRREPWAAIQKSVKNPIMSADELIKKML